MDLKDLKQVERIIFGLAALTLLFFAAGYFIHMVFFYLFLACILAYFVIWAVFWKCPHCGKRLWFNFDAPCKHCHRNVFEKPEEKPKNTKERTGFFKW